MAYRAKVFRNGRSQAVRLPAEFRFEETEVFIRRDENSGDVILSRRPESWDEFFSLADSMQVPQDFLVKRVNRPPQERDLL